MMLTSMQLETAEQVKAFAHPMRIRILTLLAGQAMTNKQLAEELSEAPAKSHFHVRELLKAGLVEIVEERPKGGVLEKYYRSAAKAYQLHASFHGSDLDDVEITDATLHLAREEYDRARQRFSTPLPSTRIVHERATVSTAAMERINSHIDAITAELQSALQHADPEGESIVLTCLIHPAA